MLGNGADDATEKGFAAAFAPVQGLGDVVQVTQAALSVCALRRGGAVACWGADDDGRLGIAPDAKPCSSNHAPCVRVPTEVPGLRDIVEISAPDALCARSSTGKVQCLRHEGGGVAFHEVVLPSPATQLVSTLGTRCALLESHEIYCWGKDDHGQTGRGRILRSDVPVQVAGVEKAAHVDAGITGVAALESGAVRLWGQERVSADIAIADAVNVAGSCAIRRDGSVWCWGRNADGQMGIGVRGRSSGDEPSKATQVPGIGDVTSLVSDGDFAECALRKDGTVTCWGENLFANLPGHPGTGPLVSPAPLPGPTRFQEISMGYGLDSSGAVWSWAPAHRGKAPGPTRLTSVPPVAHLSKHAKIFTSRWGAGGEGCFVLTDATVFCDGPNPKVEGLADVVELAAAARPAGCALRKGGVVRCWAYAEGTEGAKDVIVDVMGDARELTGTSGGYCALKTDGTVWCWGDNATGLFGPEVPIDDAPPAPVAGL